MNWLIQIVSSWSSSEHLALAITAIVSLFLLAALFLRTVRIILRGYPPPKAVREDCPSTDNFTGGCLLVGGCRTRDECDRMIETLTLREEE